MSELLGNGSLCAAFFVAGFALVAAAAAVRFDSAAALRWARNAILIMTALLTMSAAVLLTALLRGDFNFAYVASYTERALPFGYKLAAFWAGQEGSLLLWAWMLGVFSSIAVVNCRREVGREPAIRIAILAIVCGFFVSLMLFAANPFTVLTDPPADGRGLNPMLQNWAMIAHPPTLFLGYAGFTIPFAFMIAALGVGVGKMIGWIRFAAGYWRRGCCSAPASSWDPGGPMWSWVGAATGRGTRWKMPRCCLG